MRMIKKIIEKNIFILGGSKKKQIPKIIVKSLAIVLLFFTLNYIMITDTKICLCVVAKNENLYVREYVEYYKKIGYNNIFIYDNNDKNGEHFEEVINDYIKSGFVKIIDFHDRNRIGNPQYDAYRNCYSKNNKLYDWLSFYDMDEFLELNEKYKTIQNFLNDKIFENCQNIKINWLIFKSNKNLYYVNKPLRKRFNNSNASENYHIKSTVRGNLPSNYWENMKNPHTSQLNITSCSTSGKIIESNSPFNKPPDYSNAKLIHYHYKSFEEYCLKIKRGKADRKKYNNDKIILRNYKILYLSNKNNIEKLKIIKKVFNDSFFDIN